MKIRPSTYKTERSFLSLTPFEMAYLVAEHVLPYHLVKVRRDVKRMVSGFPSPVTILDVGSRKSHYTIGLNAEIYLLDVPRITDIQKDLNLGVTDNIISQTQKRRSNIHSYVIEDFLHNNIADESFTIVMAKDVIEHINDDHTFIENAFRALKKGGALYLTTPNGAVIKNTNPDHVRHYTAGEFKKLISRYFRKVDVRFGDIQSKYRVWGMDFYKHLHGPLIMKHLTANIIHRIENMVIKATENNSAKLFATAYKE